MLNLLSRFVDSNERNVRRLKPIVEEINGLEAEFEALSDADIRARMIELRDQIREDAAPSEPPTFEIQTARSRVRMLEKRLDYERLAEPGYVIPGTGQLRH